MDICAEGLAKWIEDAGCRLEASKNRFRQAEEAEDDEDMDFWAQAIREDEAELAQLAKEDRP